ncbi:hypothetical protein [Klebsiella sp. BIGb0407]|uniref:hypothetical protein n=1 Tax=Klebsiella sp. BIGb0407 TaxID=2940603 RepID=UPI002169FFCD|nr:hypothetical protein [Klebsiella sp. BIGb0407]MCS3430025.1 drug/metabolite transporter (DMT)-like permease [Klebsiella sp. BIGb0407]
MEEQIQPSIGRLENQRSPEVLPSINNSSDGTSSPGAIAAQIGTGEHAKDSFIWATLKYCFYLGGIFSAGMMLAYLYYVIQGEPDKIDIVGSLKDVWAIFTPILTLALGYAFGKRDRGSD